MLIGDAALRCQMALELKSPTSATPTDLQRPSRGPWEVALLARLSARLMSHCDGLAPAEASGQCLRQRPAAKPAPHTKSRTESLTTIDPTVPSPPNAVGNY
jgi:hypothetical protein